MNEALNRKIVAITSPGAIVDDASWTTNEVDTAEWDQLEIIVQLGSIDATMAALAATESDTSGSGHGNITGAIFGTSNNDADAVSSLPGATDDNKVYSILIDLRARKRYIDLTATAGNGAAGTYMSAIGILSRGKIGPNTAVESGYAQRLIV